MAIAIAIALAALVFTVSSFWWIHVRRGHLEAYEPQTYAGYIIGAAFRLRLPLTLYNTGARAIVVTDLRVVFVDQGVTVPVITFRHTVKPTPDDVADFAHPFAVPGRSTASRFVEFGHKSWAPAPEQEHAVRVEVKTGDDASWHELLVMRLTAPDKETASSYIAHRRDPSDDAPPPSVWEQAVPAACRSNGHAKVLTVSAGQIRGTGKPRMTRAFAWPSSGGDGT